MSFGVRHHLGARCDEEPKPITWREVLWGIFVPLGIAIAPKVVDVVHDEIKARRKPAETEGSK